MNYRPHRVLAVALVLATMTAASTGAGSLPLPSGAAGGFVPDSLFRDVTAAWIQPGSELRALLDLALADVDGDGDLDLALAGWNQAPVLYINDGRGRFENESWRLPTFIRAVSSMLAADVDGDADVDLVYFVVDFETHLLLNDGTGNFTDASDQLVADSRWIQPGVGDFDGDGDLDLVMGSGAADYWDPDPQVSTALYVNNGRGQFREDTTRFRGPPPNSWTVTAGDLDGDGDLDLVSAGRVYDEDRIFINDGSGFFDEESFRLPPKTVESDYGTREAELGDIDGDGDLDIIMAAWQGVHVFGQNRVLVNDGRGYFTDETTARYPDDPDRTYETDLIDLDADGDLDILAMYIVEGVMDNPAPERGIRAFVNDGSGHFLTANEALLPAKVPAETSRAVSGDIDGDGVLDLVLIESMTRNLWIYQGRWPAGEVGCRDIRKLQARCSGGNASVTVKLTTKAHQGHMVGVRVGDQVRYLEIKKKKAKGTLPGYSGPTLMQLWGPGECKQTVQPTC